jgi:hypothetical protein
MTEGSVRTLIVFLVVASLSRSALAQALPRLDPSATRRAVAAAAVSPHQTSRTDRLIRDTLIGAGAGALTGWVLWAAARDCGTCGPGPAHAVVSTGSLGAAVGAWIGVVQGWGAGRHPDTRTGLHLTADATLSPSRVGGAVKIAF